MDIKQKLLAVLGSGAIAALMVLVPHFEGVRYVAYQDSVGVWTICYGHTRGVRAGMTATQAQCDAWLVEDIEIALDAVDRNVRVPISETERAALGDFAFNLGEPNLRKSTLLRLVNLGRQDDACNEYRRWVLAGGRKLDGLVRRRDVEEWLCRM
ncbi:muraminidase [Pandoraea eparura]|uniref:Lysozyme n=1 Tax=Pandoraea eparura TaxID=2508291 RepID=A0A5E4SJE8_9BURK|nr:lysozyme [Pandoraea eparura]VVD76046.1 muraminidase [Pandoraea eparura]